MRTAMLVAVRVSPFCAKLAQRPTWVYGCYASTSARPNEGRGRNTKLMRPPVRRFIPDEAKKFVKLDGKLITTKENRDFLVENELDPDNGNMTKLSSSHDLAEVAKEYNFTLAFSPRHIIHPFDLRYFEPRGHPLAAMKRAKYLRKKREEPLWIIATSVGGVSPVVRTLAQRRLKGALYRALERLGYQDGGKGDGKEIRGTVWLTLHNPVKAASLPAEKFGRVIAGVLDKQCSTETV